MRSKLVVALVLGSLVFAVIPLASAQMGQGMMRGDGNGPGWHMWGNGPGWWGGADAMESRIDGRLAFLKAELKITDAQSVAWEKVATALRESAKSMSGRMATMHSDDQASQTLPQRLELHEQFMTARLDEIKQVKAALNDLYSVLSDTQKKEADALVLPMMGMGMGMMGGGRGMGWWRR